MQREWYKEMAISQGNKNFQVSNMFQLSMIMFKLKENETKEILEFLQASVENVNKFTGMKMCLKY